MKVTKANCGASVKAANGGYMKVKKTGYNEGGAASKMKSESHFLPLIKLFSNSTFI